MTRPLRIFVGAIALLAPIQAAPSAGDIPSNAERYMQAVVARRHFSGVVIIARAGKLLFAQPYGMANYEDGTPNTMQTKFRIGSMTKQFTAMAVMILQDRGKLSVGESVCKYLEPCPAAWQPITIKNLLTHTSGIPNYDLSRYPAG